MITDRAVARFGDGNKWLKASAMQHCCVLNVCSTTLSALAKPASGRRGQSHTRARRWYWFALDVETANVPAGFAHLMHDNVGLQRLDFVVHRRQFVIICGNQLHRLVGDMRIARQHGGNRLTDVAHFVDGEDRDRGTPGRNKAPGSASERPSGDDAINTFGARGFTVNASYPREARSSEKLCRQHARQLQVMRIVGPLGDLGAHFRTAESIGRPGSLCSIA